MVGDLSGRSFLVTGANTGIGKVTALELARRGGKVWLAGRSQPKAMAVIDEIRGATGNDALGFLPLDLGDFMKSPEEGAQTSLMCATDPALAAASGRYYDSGVERPANRIATAELAAELWARSERWTEA